ncbi:MAG: SDR family NAD(P)-dependent oxidoreductase [Thermodesulfobacteriota bacterium]
MDQPELHMEIERSNQARGTRSAIVTGGASGIGRALAEELAGSGVYVVIADRQVDLAEQVSSGIRAQGGAATATELDVRDLDRFRKVVQVTVAGAGRLDYLFNNAGICVTGEIRDFEPTDWYDVIDVNLRGVANGILAAYPLMIEQGFGHIVNTASITGLIAGPMQGSYSATKYAVVGLSRALRIEGRRYGVKVSVLCPGVIRTPIIEGGRYGRFKLDPALLVERIKRLRPMDPSLFARRVLRAVERNRGIIIEPKWWGLLWYLDRLSPWLGERLAEASLRSTLGNIIGRI